MTLDDLAAQGGEPQATGAAGDPQRRVEHCELADRIDTALEALVPGQRDVVILHELHGLTYGECAAALAIPVGTVKSRLSLALGRLRTGLSQYVTSAEPTAPTADDHTTGGAGAAATTCSSAGAAPNGKAAAQ
jgi:DNA-directed RNA polymerase specialized sigma24 family protein